MTGDRVVLLTTIWKRTSAAGDRYFSDDARAIHLRRCYAAAIEAGDLDVASRLRPQVGAAPNHQGVGL